MTKRKKREKDKPLPPLSHVPPWEKRKSSHHASKVGIAVFLILLVGIVIGVNVGRQPTITDPPIISTNHNGNTSNSTAPAPPTSNGNNSAWSPTPTNSSNPNSPPPPSPPATLVYGVVNMGLGANYSAVTWIVFNSTSGVGVYNTTMTEQWNQWKTNTWFDYSIILPSNATYFVTIHQVAKTWITSEGSITPSGSSFSQNFVVTGNPY